jgi:hypothetical protein
MTQSPMHRKSQARQPQRLMGACRARVRLSTVQVAITSSALDQPTLQSLDHHESESPINRPGGSRRFQFLTLIFRPQPTNDWRGLPRLDTSLDDAMILQQPVTGIGVNTLATMLRTSREMVMRRAGELGVSPDIGDDHDEAADTRAFSCRDKRLVDPLLERLKQIHGDRT